LGEGQTGGSSAAVLAVQSALEADSSSVAIMLDCANAFNACNRDMLAHTLFASEDASALWRMFDMLYVQHCTPLVAFAMDGSVSQVISSQSGVRQGEPLSSFLFAFLVQPIYELVSDLGLSLVNGHNARGDESTHHDITSSSALVKGNMGTTVAILDDFTIVGPPPVALWMVKQFQHNATSSGIFLRPSKCTVLSQGPPTPLVSEWCRENNFRICIGMAECLGSVVGSDFDRMTEWVGERVERMVTFFRRLSNQSMPTQTAWMLIRMSGTARFNHFARTLPPFISNDAAKAFDARAAFHARQILGLDQLHPFQQAQMLLPLSRGGLGLRPQHHILHSSFFSSVLSSTHLLHCSTLIPPPDQQPQRSIIGAALTARDHIINNAEWEDGTAPSIISRSATLHSFLQHRHPAFNQHYQSPQDGLLESDVRFAERDCSRGLVYKVWSEMINEDSESVNVRRSRHCSEKRVSQWIVLDDASFKAAARELLGIHPHEGVARCRCNAESGSEPIEHHQCALNCAGPEPHSGTT